MILLFIPTILNAEYKISFKNKEIIKIPESTMEEANNPETESGYLTLFGESDITITASKIYSSYTPEGAFDGYIREGSTSEEKVIPENKNPPVGKFVWISGWHLNEDNNDFLYNQWLDVKFNDGVRDISGFEIWPTKYSLDRAPYHVKIQYSRDNGVTYQDGEEFYLNNKSVKQRKEFSLVLKNVTNIRFFMFENHGSMDTLEVDEIQFF